MKAWILVFCFCIVIGSSFAQFAGGSGTESDPWQVATAVHLDNVRNYLGEEHSDKHFIQTADIDLGVAPWNQGEGWVPIGTDNNNRFYANYNGDEKVISNLYINRPDDDYQGLFGSSFGRVENIGLENVNVSGNSRIGAIVGYLSRGTLSNCYSAGNVYGMEYNTGGLVGYSSGGIISNCYSTANVSGYWYNGGLVGYASSTLNNCYSTGTVSGDRQTGGLVGYNNNSTISNCYSTGTVSGNIDTGGLVGGNYYGTLNNCYWDIQTSGQINSAGGEGKDTDQMVFPHPTNTYVNWDWRIWKPDLDHSVNDGYPFFRPMNEVATQLPQATIDPVPADESVQIPIDCVLRWQVEFSMTNADPPSGFKLWLGTDNPPSNIINGLDLGYANEFESDTYLSLNSSYYWRVVPYNQAGETLEVPVWSFSTYTTTTFSGGTGIEQDPWQIATAGQLYNLRYYLGENHADKYFIQTADIDLGVAPWNQGEGWEPIGNDDNYFYANYNGNGKVVSNLFINRPNTDYQGLFGYSSGQIENLGIENVSVSGYYYVGGLLGRNLLGTINNCYSTSIVSGRYQTGGLVGISWGTLSNSYSISSVNGNKYTGGLVGYNYNVQGSLNNSYSSGYVSGNEHTGGLVGGNTSTMISNCYSTSNVSGYLYSGGLIGYNSSGTLNNCYSTGSVNGKERNGGLVGLNFQATLNNCYSTGSVNGNNATGGLVGSNTQATFNNCYSTGNVRGSYNTGGMVGYNTSGTYSNCYWDKQTSGKTSSAGGEGRTTAEMTFPYAANTYVGWDFQNVWAEDFLTAMNDGYPFLNFLITQKPNPAINPEPTNPAYEVPLDSTLSWQSDYQPNGSDAPTGFKLRLGTDNPPSNILYDMDLGASLTYIPELPWAENTTYFWQILPYNHVGEADNCPVWSFSTHAALNAEISVSQISFGNVWIDHQATKTFTVSNLGALNLELNILLSTGAFTVTTSERSIRQSIQFGQKSDDGKASRYEINLVLSPMSTETIYVHFLPTAQQQYSRNLFIETNAPNLPLFIMPLSGTGYTLYAEFSADPTSGDVPLEVNFQNQSVAGINQSLWDFGDGNTSEEMNPTHTFTQKGVYNVKLTVWDDYFNTNVTHQVTVIAHPLLTCAQEAGHIFTKTFIGEQSAPFEIILQNTGTDSLWVTGAHWRSRNRDTCFTFEYEELGEAIVPGGEASLMVWFNPLTEGVFADTLCIVNTSENIPLLKIPFSGRGYKLHAAFAAEPMCGDVPLKVEFTDLSTEDIIQWTWDFEDGSTSTEQHPVHLFEEKGLYQVELTVSDGIHYDSVSQTIEVIAHPMLASDQLVGHQFTKTYLTEESNAFEILLNSSGTDTLFVDNVYWKSQHRDHYFHYVFEQLAEPIAPGDNTTISVTFAPLGEGVFRDTLCVVNNSENLPLVEIPFSGRGYKLHADFSAEPMCGDVPLTVEFTDLSTEDIIQWNWDFGDGGTSTQQHPVHLFEEKGLYQVELTVSDGIHYDTSSQSIEVIAHPMMTFDYPQSSNFDIVYLGDISESITLTLQSTGTDTLFVNNLWWENGSDVFSFSCLDLPCPIPPGESATIDVWFHPSARGAYSDSLVIESNAENLSVVKVKFSGRGEYVPPKPPANVYLTIEGNHALIHWDEVTQTIYDTPFSPDAYIVFLAADPYDNYTFLGSSTSLSYTHFMVAAYQPRMFYKVMAYKDMGKQEFNPDDYGLVPGMTEEEVLRLLAGD